jgi:hypothetical protein
LRHFEIPKEALENDRVHIIALTQVVDEKAKILLQNGAKVLLLPTVKTIPEELRDKVRDKLEVKFGGMVVSISG